MDNFHDCKVLIGSKNLIKSYDAETGKMLHHESHLVSGKTLFSYSPAIQRVVASTGGNIRIVPHDLPCCHLLF